MNPSFEQQLSAYKTCIEEYLKNYFTEFPQEPQKPLFEAMAYSLLAGGKRLRPVFVFDFCRMCGGSWQDAVPFAAAMEMVHTYSLIHDDLPCMDNDDFRRGRPTNHKVYGEGLAVLAGDALLTDAFAVACRTKLKNPADMGKAISVLSTCAGSSGMVGGQVLDIMSENRVCTDQEVLDVQIRKTGKLIKAACVLGVIAGGGSDAQIAAATDFAESLGLAFQIRDDMLDVIGTRESMGKTVGTDENKNTFVRLYGLEKCEELVCSRTQMAIDKLAAFENTEFMAALARSLTDRTN